MALPKLFQRIFFSNNNPPALNGDNLNSISKAIDDIDNRVISLASDVMETVPLILQKYHDIEELSENPPYIGDNGNWYVWDTSTDPVGYVDSGIDASITVDIADVTMLAEGASPYITNTGTDTDPIFHLFIPIGAAGDDGVSPEVAVTTITGGHRVTITDADHPTGQSFDVMDGTGNGDMQKSVYDANNAVANAGGITAYVAGQVPDISGKADKVTSATSGNFAGFDSNGNLTDSGSKASDFLTSHQDISGKMNTNGSNAASEVTFAGAFTVGTRVSGSTVGTHSMVEGFNCEASGNYSHAEGYECTASSNYCHAEGQNTTANGPECHAEGRSTVATGSQCHAEGFHTEAGGMYQLVIGKYNNNKNTTLFEVGYGTSSARSNAFEVYPNGSLSTDNGTTKTKLPVIKSKPLAAGATSVIFDNMPSSGNNLIQFYTDKPGLDYTAITTSGTNTTLTYPAQSSSTTVYCSIVEVM